MMLYKLLCYSDRKGFEPAVISLIDRGALGPRIETLGIPVFAVGMKRGMPTLSAMWRLVRLARLLKPALVQGWMSHGNLVAVLTGAIAPGSVPVLWNTRRSLYSFEHDKPLTRAVTKLGARLSGLPVRILYNSRVGAAQHEKFGYRVDKTLVIPNGFDTKLFAPSIEARNSVRVELGVVEDVIMIGLVATAP